MPAQHTEQEEDAFMRNLLHGLDASFFDAVPSPPPSSTKSRRPPPSARQTSPERPRHHAHPHSFTTPTKPRSLKRELLSTPKNKTPLRSNAVYDAGDINADEVVAGWDWDACSDYVPTPQKPKADHKYPVTTASVSEPPETYIPDSCTRCIVITVTGVWVNRRSEKHLATRTDPAREGRMVTLCDDWVNTNIMPGDTINVIGSFSSADPDLPPSISITASTNLLIHHPDHLLTPSALSSAPHCTRRPVLTSLLRSTAPSTPVLVYGNILHEIFQQSLRSGQWDTHWIENKIDQALGANLGELVRVGVSVETARRDILDRAKGVSIFGQKYVSNTPKPDAILTNTRASQNETSLLAISHLHDIEEDIWSPAYGLKGKLDASVEAVITSQTSSSSSSDSSCAPSPSRPVPFEIKTGRATAGMEHRAQTMLYTLLMSERYCTPVQEGLLYYTQSEEVICVPAARHEIRALVNVRNTIADTVARRFQKGFGKHQEEEEEEGSFLPETIDDERICGRCYSLDACMLYRKAVDKVEDTSSPIADIYALKTGHLTSAQADFFKSWERLIALEEHDMVRFRKELWTMGAQEREERGRCFADMVLDLGGPDPAVPIKSRGIHQYTYRFRRRDGVDAGSLLSGHMSVGDAVSVSVEPHLLALSRGFVLHLTPTHVLLGVDHDLDEATLRERLRRRSRVHRASVSALAAPDFGDAPQIVFRIDKDEMTGGMGRIRENLAHLFFAGGDTARLRLVVDLAPPVFIEPSSATLLQDVRDSARCKELTSDLNASQQQAIEKVLCAEDYACVLGMPGTGKTTLVACLIKVLVEMGKTVLLSSYTHSAVDTILAKLKGADFGVLRLGNVDKVHPDVFHFTLAARKKANSIEELERQLMTPPVVATTALSIDHELFSRRLFDYCIVDEASQITLPTCIGPLRFADKFILVGDHYQLSPLVRNRDARRGGLDVSLFRRLSEAHPQAVVDLNEQYRMNEHIMLLSNRLIYSNRLRCGSAEVANQSLILPDSTYLHSLHKSSLCLGRQSCWLEKLMDPNTKAVFVDTDLVPAFDSSVGDLVQNEVEAALVSQVVETLLESGVGEEDVGIITLYRQQIKLLSHLLRERTGIEILTADRSQGRDKNCIIISMVRSNDDGQIGELVKDWRRMNVAFTRARSKLVIFGSRRTLQNDSLLAEFLQLMDEQGWILQLPADAHTFHPLTHRPSETQGKRARSNTVPSKDQVPMPDLDSRSRPAKKVKTGGDEGVLRGRPVLKDLVNESL